MGDQEESTKAEMGDQEESTKAEKILSFLGIPNFLIRKYKHHHHHPQELEDVKGETQKPTVVFSGRTYFTQTEIQEAVFNLINSLRTDFSRTHVIERLISESHESKTNDVYLYYHFIMVGSKQETQLLKFRKKLLRRNNLFDALLTLERFQKRVFIPASMLQVFLLTSYNNTVNNLPSFGLCSGKLVDGSYFASVLIILIQDATFDSADEAISSFERRKGLTRLGLIYLKPSDDFCSLSPSEMHSHYPLQEKVPEAFSIVVTPKDRQRQYGIYRLTDVGKSVIEKCKQQEQKKRHKHEEMTADKNRIYYQCIHVRFIPNDKFEIRFFSSRISRNKAV